MEEQELKPGENKLKKRQKIKNTQGFTCETCSKRFSVRGNLLRHAYIIHGIAQGTPKVYTCLVCEKIFKIRYKLRMHERHYNGNCRKTCPYCDKVINENFRVHVAAHKMAKVCPICKKTFSNAGNLKMHMAVHSGARKYICETCSTPFKQLSHLKLHTCNKMKVYVCDKCNRKFHNQLRFEYHKKEHESNGTPCEKCGKIFVKAKNLRVHLSNHDSIHVCEVCGKQFAQMFRLRRHWKSHGDGWKCLVCAKTFKDKGRLQKHMKRHVLVEDGEDETQTASNFTVPKSKPNNSLDATQNNIGSECNEFDESVDQFHQQNDYEQLNNQSNDSENQSNVTALAFVNKITELPTGEVLVDVEKFVNICDENFINDTFVENDFDPIEMEANEPEPQTSGVTFISNEGIMNSLNTVRVGKTPSDGMNVGDVMYSLASNDDNQEDDTVWIFNDGSGISEPNIWNTVEMTDELKNVMYREVEQKPLNDEILKQLNRFENTNDSNNALVQNVQEIQNATCENDFNYLNTIKLVIVKSADDQIGQDAIVIMDNEQYEREVENNSQICSVRGDESKSLMSQSKLENFLIISDSMKNGSGDERAQGVNDLVLVLNEYADVPMDLNNFESNNLSSKSILVGTSGDDKSQKNEEENDPFLTCESCGMAAINKKVFIYHTSTKCGSLTEGPATCSVCSKTLNKLPALKQHIRRHLSGIKKCGECGKTFLDSSALKTHEFTHTKTRYFECRHCSKKFTQCGNLRRHIQLLHTQPEIARKFACKLCQRRFPLANLLDIHLKLHSQNPYSCGDCSRLFKTQKYLKLHQIKYHASNKCVTCHVCDKKFIRRYNLELHLKKEHSFEIESDESKVLSCTLCGKQFKHKVYLKNHQLTHDKKKFFCFYCGQKFCKKFTLIRHLTFACKNKIIEMYCNGEKAEIRELWHTKTQTVNNRVLYCCSVCGYKSMFKDGLMYHFKSEKNAQNCCPGCFVDFGTGKEFLQHLLLHAQAIIKRVKTFTLKKFECFKCDDAVSFNGNVFGEHLLTHYYKKKKKNEADEEDNGNELSGELPDLAGDNQIRDHEASNVIAFLRDFSQFLNEVITCDVYNKMSEVKNSN